MIFNLPCGELHLEVTQRWHRVRFYNTLLSFKYSKAASWCWLCILIAPNDESDSVHSSISKYQYWMPFLCRAGSGLDLTYFKKVGRLHWNWIDACFQFRRNNSSYWHHHGARPNEMYDRKNRGSTTQDQVQDTKSFSEVETTSQPLLMTLPSTFSEIADEYNHSRY